MLAERYLFRGKRLYDDTWIEGWPIQEPSGRIFVGVYYPDGGFWDWVEIDPDTLCQCTGLKDKDGVMIFEGDFVTVNTYAYEEPEYTANGYVDINPLGPGLRFPRGNGASDFGYLCDMQGSYQTEYIIYGNRFDNPELLEVE